MYYDEPRTVPGSSGAAAVAGRRERGSSGTRPSTARAHREAVHRVIRAMRDHCGEPLTLESLARVAHASPYHFSRVFRRVTGVSPVQYLAAVRLETAKRLLLTTPFSVAAICFEVGYNSVGTFTTLFTELVGVSPRRVRRMDGDTLGSVLGSLAAASAAARSAGRASEVRVQGPAGFSGPVFVGLFPEAIPRGQPAACTVLEGPGTAHLPAVPDGRYHLFAVGLTRADDPVESLLCAGALRAGGVPLAASGGVVRGVTLALRPPEPTDPPLLPALPCLLEERLERARGAAGGG